MRSYKEETKEGLSEAGAEMNTATEGIAPHTSLMPGQKYLQSQILFILYETDAVMNWTGSGDEI